MSDIPAICRFFEYGRYEEVHYGFVGDEKAACGRDGVAVKPNVHPVPTREFFLAYEPQEGDCAACIRAIQRRLRAKAGDAGADAPKGSETSGTRTDA